MTIEDEALVPFSPGDTIAEKYRIDRILGAGGMGVVVAATHLDLDTKVAIKVMREELTQDASAVQRLLLEARSAAKIRSEHVARVLDVGTLPSGAPYIVMEYLEGCDLAGLLESGGPLTLAQAVDFLLEACEALAEAHKADIVHRDLKPENLFVARRADGSSLIKVVDFGISKNLGAEAKGRALTNPSTAVGSPQYMAPEQMQARGVDTRADIWALGVILYELLTGRQAFEGETLPEVCAKVLGQEPPPIESVRSDLPDGISQVIATCMSKTPDARYPSIAALAEALASFGSPRARTSLERIGRVMLGEAGANSLAGGGIAHVATASATAAGTLTGADNPNSARQVSGIAQTIAATTPTGGTQSAWLAENPTQGSIPKSSNVKWVALVAVVGALIGVSAFVVQGGSGPEETAPTMGSAPERTPETDKSAPPTPEPNVTAAPDPEPAEEAAPSSDESEETAARGGAPNTPQPPSADATQAAATPKPAPRPTKRSPAPGPAPKPKRDPTKAWDTSNFGSRR